MSWWQALLLGVIQGVTEFLPISSSGHLVLAQSLLATPPASLEFTIFVHLMTVIAVVVYFWSALWRLSRQDVTALVVASVPVGVIGALFSSLVISLFASVLLVGLALVVTALANFLADRLLARPGLAAHLSWQSAAVVGFFQALALVPGVSRSGITLLGSLQQGLDRTAAFRFAFLLSIPAIVGATLFQVFELARQPIVLDWLALGTGGLAALVTGLASLRLLERVMLTAKLNWFGWYALVLGVGVVLLVSTAPVPAVLESF